MSKTIRIELGDRSYDVIVSENLLSSLGQRVRTLLPGSGRAFVIADGNLPSDTVDRVHASLRDAGFEVSGDSVNALESNKTIATADRLLHEIAETRHERNDPVIALGGGIVGDIAGFVAASFKRGVPVVQCPTTLLAMVDASVGGKTGVNISTRSGLKKNLVGAFWQPRLVLADIDTLRSLPKRELTAGLGECLKHGMIASSPGGPDNDTPGALFDDIAERSVRLRMGELTEAVDLVAQNVRVKAAFVAGDERETAPSAAGGRALLNLGHTFAHAIETIPHLTPDGNPEHAPLLHGESVALGLVAATGAARALGRVDEAFEDEVRVGVERLGIASRLMGLPDDESLLERMMHDKKVLSGRLRLVLPEGLGRCTVVEDPSPSVVRAGWDALRIHPDRRV